MLHDISRITVHRLVIFVYFGYNVQE